MTVVTCQNIHYIDVIFDVVEAHCYFDQISRTDREYRYITESITMIAEHFGHVGLCQLRTKLKKRNCSMRHVIYPRPVDSTEGGCTNEPGTATSEDVTVLDPESPRTLYNTVSLPVTIDQDLAEEPSADTAECNAPCYRDAVESFQVSDQAVLQKTRKLQGHARQFCTEWFKGHPRLVLCMMKCKLSAFFVAIVLSRIYRQTR